MSATEVDVLVIGAGQAGLSAGYHLRRRRFGLPQEEGGAGNVAGTFLIVDANPGPGGAWQHRWDSLTMATVNNIYDLPGMPQKDMPDEAIAREVLTEYFAEFEEKFQLRVLRPLKAVSVENLPDRRILTRLDNGEEIISRFLINATGTWTHPHIPYYPGMERFQGRYVHTQTYLGPQDFVGERVGIVGVGISATQHLAEISRVAQTWWFTRHKPDFREEGFNGHDAVALVEERVREGYSPLSVVSVTGLRMTPMLRDAQARGALVDRPMFSSIDETGVIMPDGEHIDLDTIVWATGFKAELGHLVPLNLRNDKGGITMDPPQVAGDPRLFLVGYGPSASTVGANRAGRDAVIRITRQLRAQERG